jgi:surface carbohydrate biosynthesis protein
MNKLSKLIIFFFLSKWSFKNPKKKDILIYDSYQRLIDDLFCYLDPKKVGKLYMRGEELNVIILIKSLFSKNFYEFKRNYIVNYINYTNPKIIITATDNDMVFYTLKEHFKNKIIFITMQNGLRGMYDDFEEFKNYKKKSKYKLSVDYFFSLNDSISLKYKKYIRAKFIPIGLFRNNLVKKVKVKYKKRILFISSFSKKIHEGHFFLNSKKKYADGDLFFKADIVVLKYLINFSKKNNFNLRICLRRDENINEQKYLINHLLSYNKNLKFIIPKQKFDVYKEVDRAKYVTCIDSALGYEAYARGSKVGFFSIKGNYLGIDSLNFGWPSKLPKANFWTNNEKNFNSLMWYLINKNYSYNSYRLKNKSKIIYYDPGNSIFIKILKKLNIDMDKKIKNKFSI